MQPYKVLLDGDDLQDSLPAPPGDTILDLKVNGEILGKIRFDSLTALDGEQPTLSEIIMFGLFDLTAAGERASHIVYTQEYQEDELWQLLLIGQLNAEWEE